MDRPRLFVKLIVMAVLGSLLLAFVIPQIWGTVVSNANLLRRTRIQPDYQ